MYFAIPDIQANPESCYYHGTVHGKPDSVVALHTCNGLRLD